jgi:hypothetical protein
MTRCALCILCLFVLVTCEEEALSFEVCQIDQVKYSANDFETTATFQYNEAKQITGMAFSNGRLISVAYAGGK